MKDFIPVCEPCLTGNEKAYLQECIDTGWVSSEGPFVRRFERAVADWCGMPHAISVANGSVALDLACEALGIVPGDEVIMPSFTIISCAAAVVRLGGTPVLVDSDPVTWQMDASAVAKAITSRTKAIMVVHIYGHPADFDPIAQVAKSHGLAIIEDAAEVHGALYKDRPCGGLGDISCFSFYANKLVTTGEGGMVLCRDAALANRLKSLRNLCFLPDRRFIHEELGHNFRLTNLQAALGVAQLESLDKTVAFKRAVAHRYDAAFKGHPLLKTPVEEEWARNVYWVYGLVLDDRLPFDAFEWAEKLKERGVDTRPFFAPMHIQPVFRRMGMFANLSLPVSERLYARGLYLPNGMNLTGKQQETVIAAVLETLDA